MDELTQGGNGGAAPEEPTRSDLALVQRALRQDWAIPPKVKQELLQTLVNISANATSPRTRIAAAKAIALLARLNLGQQAIDLAREKHEGGGDWNLSELVSEAEQIAVEHQPALPPAEPKPK